MDCVSDSLCVAQVMVGAGESMTRVREEYGDSVAGLMGAALMLDTRLFKGKCADLDAALGRGLGYFAEAGEASAEAEGYFKRLSERRADVRGLTSAQKLRKDYKRWGEGHRAYGIATVPCSLADWAEDDAGWGAAVVEFALKEDVGVIMVMLTYSGEGGQFGRELVVHCKDAGRLETLCKHLCGDGHALIIEVGTPPDMPSLIQQVSRCAYLGVSTSCATSLPRASRLLPLLTLVLQATGGSGSLGLESSSAAEGLALVKSYIQNNLKASRKQVQPVADIFMNEKNISSFRD